MLPGKILLLPVFEMKTRCNDVMHFSEVFGLNALGYCEF